MNSDFPKPLPVEALPKPVLPKPVPPNFVLPNPELPNPEPPKGVVPVVPATAGVVVVDPPKGLESFEEPPKGLLTVVAVGVADAPKPEFPNPELPKPELPNPELPKPELVDGPALPLEEAFPKGDACDPNAPPLGLLVKPLEANAPVDVVELPSWVNGDCEFDVPAKGLDLFEFVETPKGFDVPAALFVLPKGD